MALSALTGSEFNTEITQAAPGQASRRPAGTAKRRPQKTKSRVAGDSRESVRDPARLVVELDHGITVYPPEAKGEPWRAVFTENGQRRYRQARSEAKLAAKLAKVTERLAARAPDMQRPGADLIAHYLDLDRLPPSERWSRRHADTQTRLCRRFATPVIAAVTCQDITVDQMQAIVNAAPTAGEGDRVHRMISAMVGAGIRAGYLTSSRLGDVHWQAGTRAEPEAQVSVAGESPVWVDPAEIPSDADIYALGKALAAGRRGGLDELMANTAAYTGLRQGELFALTVDQVATDDRVITVDRKVIEVAGKLYVEAPKCRKYRSTIYPRLTPSGYPLAERMAVRVEQARAEQQAGKNPAGLIFPSPRLRYWRSSNFDRRVLAPAYLTAGWRDATGAGDWTWHSLRHRFCTTALFTWKLDPTDVSRMAGHSNYRTTLDMYVGTTAGLLDRARTATQ
jgi:integrase